MDSFREYLKLTEARDIIDPRRVEDDDLDDKWYDPDEDNFVYGSSHKGYGKGYRSVLNQKNLFGANPKKHIKDQLPRGMNVVPKKTVIAPKAPKEVREFKNTPLVIKNNKIDVSLMVEDIAFGNHGIPGVSIEFISNNYETDPDYMEKMIEHVSSFFRKGLKKRLELVLNKFKHDDIFAIEYSYVPGAFIYKMGVVDDCVGDIDSIVKQVRPDVFSGGDWERMPEILSKTAMVKFYYGPMPEVDWRPTETVPEDFYSA